jgi:hypothetical protein
VQVELPSDKAPQQPFAEPAPLKAVLLDLTLPMSLAAVWLALFHNASSLLADFHKQLEDRDITVASWRKTRGASRLAVLFRAVLYILSLSCPHLYCFGGMSASAAAGLTET